MMNFSKIVRFAVVFALAFTVAVPAMAQQKTYRYMNPIVQTERDKETEKAATDAIAKANAAVREVSSKIEYGFDWLGMTALIIFCPLIVLLIPGKGKSEKIIEGIALVAIGIFFHRLAGETHIDSVQWYATLVCIVPGVLLFLWGVVSGDQVGKVALMGGVVALFAVFLLGKGIWHFFVAPWYISILTVFLAFVALGGLTKAKA